jgi:hypothetical protein
MSYDISSSSSSSRSSSKRRSESASGAMANAPSLGDPFQLELGLLEDVDDADENAAERAPIIRGFSLQQCQSFRADE